MIIIMVGVTNQVNDQVNDIRILSAAQHPRHCNLLDLGINSILLLIIVLHLTP